MSLVIEYRKEFENMILNGNLEEALKTLVPNSKEELYLRFCEEFKKCYKEKKISKELDNIIEIAKSNNLSEKLIKILETRKDLLEYDLPSTSKERKDKIIDFLFNNYCGEQLDYDAPFFVRGKKSKNEDEEEELNNTPLILTEEMITDAVKKNIEINEDTKLYEIKNTPINKRHKLLLEYIDRNKELCFKIISRRIDIPFYLMSKEEFSKVIDFINNNKKILSNFDFSGLTVIQIMRLLKEVKFFVINKVKEDDEGPSEKEILKKRKKPKTMITKDGQIVKVVYDKKQPNKRKIINEDGESEDVNEIESEESSENDEKTGKKKPKRRLYVTNKGDIIELEEASSESELQSESESPNESESKKEIVSFLIKNKYNKMIKKAKKRNDLKEVKKLLWEIYDICKNYCIEYVSGILLYILKLNKIENIYEFEALEKYLRFPINDIGLDKIYNTKQFNKRINPISIPGIDFNQISRHKFIEDLLIDFLFLSKAQKDNFSPFFKMDYLEKINLIAQLYKEGEISSEKYKGYLKDSEYDKIAKRTEMTICEHNPKEFKINEDIKIDIDFKNIKSINISIYEINTENYYLEKKAPLNSLFNIEGIIASNNMDIKIEGGENPFKRIRKTIELSQIEKGKPGIYLIEILGKGISSRIIIKRGRLNLITRNTSKGILCQIINENNEIIKDNKTYLWYNNNKFSCEPKEGIIILPYKVLVDPSNKCILVHDSYADLAEIKSPRGNYELKGYFYILNESIIPGNMLKVNFKPFLFANGRETTLELIKKGTITVEMEKSENNKILPVSTIFENITFKDDSKDYEFEVLIPPMMTKMKFIFNCEINNIATGEKKSMSYEQNSDFVSSNDKISIALFHKVGKNYIYEEIGRNGEKIASNVGNNAQIELWTNYFLDRVEVSLQFDEEGKLNLGELKDVIKVKIRSSTFYLNEYSKYCYPERIDIVLGESFTLPIYSHKAISLDNFILYQYYNSKNMPSVLMDNKKEIILNQLDINGDKEHYYEFTLGKTLPKGKYYLSFENNDIIIKVREGKHWMNIENYIIDEKGFLENSKNKTPIYMKNLSINKEKGEIEFECSKTRRNIKYTHANIYLSQYQKPQINSYFYKYRNILDQGVENLISIKFSNWSNMYLSNRVLNEEIEYVLQRRNLEDQIGNSLPMPSLLLKRAYKRDCNNEEEDLEDGDNYSSEDADMGTARNKPKSRWNKEDKEGTNTDFYNFLKYSGYVLNNIEPININSNDEFAKFKIKFNEKEKDILNKYSYIQIILIDNKSISSDFHCLCSDNDKFIIEKRNISNEKALDSNKNITEIKTTELIKKGKEFNIDETANYKLVDSIQKLSKFYLLTLKDKDKYWNQFNFILNLNANNFNEEEFIENYNQVCGHEINLFLYFKYPKLFDKYVKNMLKYKYEKTFIDYFLLDDYEKLLDYLNPLKIKLLPINELCLLMIKIVEKKPDEAKKIKDIIKSRIEKPEEIENLLFTNFNIMMNMIIDDKKQLNKRKILNEDSESEELENMITKDGKKVKVVYDKKVPNKRKIINEDGESEDVEELEIEEPTEYDERTGKKKPKKKKYVTHKSDIIELEEESPSESEPLEEEPTRRKKSKQKKPQNMITKDGKKVKVVYDKKVPNKRKIINEDEESEDVGELEEQELTEYDEKRGKKKPKKKKYVANKGDIIELLEDDDYEFEQEDKKMEQVDFIYEEKKDEYNYALKKAKEEMGNEYEKPGVVKEYKERHYYLKEHKNSEIKNPIWLDFAEHILSNQSYDNFLSKYILYNKIEFNEYLFILSIIGIPVESTKHEYKRVPNSRLINVIPGSNLILFTKELKETKLNINDKLIISQNVKDELHNDMNVNISNCTIGITYTHQTIITNISNKRLMFQLFIQIPQGAICLNSTYYTNSIKMDLKPYKTKNYETYFYFPNVGKFPQYHPLACENSNIISIGNSLLYEVKKEYIPSKKCEVIEDNKYAKDMRIEGKLRNILSDDNIESKDKLNNILNYFNNDIFDEEDINNILYLLKKNKSFYTNLISALRDRGYYSNKVWSFSFYHKDEEGIKEYLCNNNDLINDLGYDYKSSLYSYSDIVDASIRPHLEYSPLYNARKHPFGNRGKSNESSIANQEFKEAYNKFIIDLLSLRELTIKEKLQLIYYLILQDRMEEALNILQKIKKEEVEDNKNKSYRIQYDYINAYLDFCFGYPEFKIAKSLCSKYKDFPLEHWNEKFNEIEYQLFEYEKKEKISLDNMISDSNDKKALNKELREKEPKISLNIDKKEAKITIMHSNINKIDIQLYLIDLETMFTRNPKISEIINKDQNNVDSGNIENFGLVQPNYSETIKIPKEKVNNKDNITIYEIPQNYRNKNLFVEVKAESIKLFDLCLSSNLVVMITESLGELKVIDNNFQSVIKAYVKVYVELKESEVQFYKDGYTDLNGKFNYLALNTDQLKKARKFYIFVSEEKQGAVIKECYPPKNIKNISSDDDLLGDIYKLKQNQRNQWRKMNKLDY